YLFFFFSSRRRHTRSKRDWSSDVCSSDLSIQTTADTSPDELFKSGKAAMVYGGSFRVAGYVDSAVGENIQVVWLPIGEQRGVVQIGRASCRARVCVSRGVGLLNNVIETAT